MRTRFSLFTKLTFAGLCLGIAGGTLFSLRLLQKYPWQTVSPKLSNVKSSIFVEHWPTSSLDEERQSRKNLRRYPKKEQERRLEIQRRRMKFVNSTLSDIFLDTNLQFTPNIDPIQGMISGLQWPNIKTLRSSTDPAMKNRISYVVLPSHNGTSLTEGLLMNAGEELRFTFPLSKSPRGFDFEIYPLTPTNLRAQIGQYSSWGRNFNETDINSLQSTYVPMNDPSASSLRLQALSGSFYILEPKITVRESTGRMPVQISMTSQLWKPNPQFFVSGTPQTVASETEESEAMLQNGVEDPAAQAGDASQTTAESDATAGASALTTGSPSLDLDLLEQRANQQIPANGKHTTALGYNLVLFQLESIPWKYFSDFETFEKVAPNIANFMTQSVNVLGRLDVPNSKNDLYRRTILGNEIAPSHILNGLLLKQYLNNESVHNLYYLLRKYSYHVASFAPAETLGINSSLTANENMPRLTGRWLDETDQLLFDKRAQIDAQNEPLIGLDAVFPSKTFDLKLPLRADDYREFSKLLARTAEASQRFPDWRANDLVMLDNRSSYYAKLVESFQNWVKDNTQLRFFAHVLVDDLHQKTRPSIKDFWKIVKLRRINAFTSPEKTADFARLALLDKSFGQMIDAVSAKRIEHRTIVGVIIPHTSTATSRNTGASLLIKIPGTLTQNDTRIENINVDDVVSTMLTRIGIPMGQNVPDSISNFNGRDVETISPNDAPTKRTAKAESTATKRFFMLINPLKQGCAPFEWRAANPIFGLRATSPVIETSNSANWIRVFPCSIKETPVQISWYQEVPVYPASIDDAETVIFRATDVPRLLGGHFVYDERKQPIANLPMFVFGKRMYQSSELVFAMNEYQGEELARIFEFDSGFNDSAMKLLLKKMNVLANVTDAGKQSQRTVVFFGRGEP